MLSASRRQVAATVAGMADIFDTGPVAAVADERTTLGAFLDYLRVAIVAKVRGLSEEDVRRRLVRSETTLAGILQHLTRVEASWFQHRLDRIPAEEVPVLRRWLADPDSEFRVGSEEAIEDLIRNYERECERSREVASRHQLDDLVPHPALGEVSMRWIFIHMIEETARHAGHADILREQIDGSTGD